MRLLTRDLRHRGEDVGPATQASTAPNDERVRVLYVVGPSRGGSTIIANTLGQLPGCFAVGELWNIWRRGLLERRLCGCGLPLPDCELWSEVLHRTFHGELPGQSEARRLDELGRSKLKVRRLGALLAGFGRPPEHDLDDYRRVLVRLYAAVAEVTGCRVVIDSSKGPEYGFMLASLPNLRVSMVNVVRDSRAVAFSRKRPRALPDFGDHRLMRQVPAWVAARRWLKTQAVAGTVLRARVPDYRCVKYEDFARNPQTVIADLAALVGAPTSLPFESDRTVRMGTTHSVSGNPARFNTGLVPIRVDEEWRHAMRRRDLAVVTALTCPMLLYHHYPLLPRRQANGAGHDE